MRILFIGCVKFSLSMITKLIDLCEKDKSIKIVGVITREKSNFNSDFNPDFKHDFNPDFNNNFNHNFNPDFNLEGSPIIEVDSFY